MHYRPRDTVSVCGMNKIKDLRAIYSDNDNVSSTLLLLGTGAGLSHFFVYHLCFDPLSHLGVHFT